MKEEINITKKNFVLLKQNKVDSIGAKNITIKIKGEKT